MIRWLALTLLLGACGDGASVFVGDRIRNLCLEAYPTCGTTAGCRLSDDQYVVGTFPGARRLVVHSEADETDLEVRIYLEEAISPGTEIQIQARDSDCSLDIDDARFEDDDYDLIDEAGGDGLLLLDPLTVSGPGEHLIEVFSDARARYLMTVERVPAPLGGSDE